MNEQRVMEIQRSSSSQCQLWSIVKVIQGREGAILFDLTNDSSL